MIGEVILYYVAAFAISPSKFNLVFDFISPVYTIAVLFLIVKAYRTGVTKSSSHERKTYSLSKNNKQTPGNWKRAFEGKWDLLNRTGWKEFAIFMGKSSFVAGLANAQPFGQIISYKSKDNESEMKIDATGVPANDGPWVVIGGPQSPTKQDGKAVLEKMTWDEENKKLIRIRESTEGGYINYQERYINEQGHLIIDVTYTRTKDNASVKIHIECKRKE